MTRATMQKSNSRRSQGAAARVLALLLVICLAECATEQRFNRIGSKAALVEKVNGWRSQRGGSCLSYGHSCWGAHGKRSGKPPAAAPDWYLTRLLRRMAANTEMNRARQEATNDDLNAIFQMDVPDDSQANKPMNINENSAEVGSIKTEAIPMLDDELLAKMRLWKIMRDSAEEK